MDPASNKIPFVNSIFHPSDFSEASESAFAHALAIALKRKCRFTILHAGKSREAWTNFPAIRSTLERWGLLEAGSSKSAVAGELNVQIQKVAIDTDEPVESILDYLERHPTDLIVLATEGREGLPRWIKHSVAEKVAEGSNTMTLFVPSSAAGFVNHNDGKISLKRILVPIDREPSPVPAVEYAARSAGMADGPVEIILLNIGDGKVFETLELKETPGLKWDKLHREGNVVDEIAAVASDRSVDLIVMTTEGRKGFLDALRGSITQQVVRHVPCPLLAVPVKKYNF
jgi:nucleotide-binding universal stress UspA family protein